MRLSKARIPPLRQEDLTLEQAALAAVSHRPRIPQIALTLARSPVAFAAIKAMGDYLSSDACGLSVRQREIITLRTAFLCQCGYVWTAHQGLGAQCGLTEQDFARVKQGADAGWAASEASLICAVDDLHRDQFISEPVWAELGRHFDDHTRMDVVFVVGQYSQIAMLLNSFGVQIEAGRVLDPDLQAAWA